MATIGALTDIGLKCHKNVTGAGYEEPDEAAEGELEEGQHIYW